MVVVAHVSTQKLNVIANLIADAIQFVKILIRLFLNIVFLLFVNFNSIFYLMHTLDAYA
jgi:hypothetical protein